ncbi:hypothetical protein Asp14428_12210 [Actinoplanes sp. NBRC 14428]|nr:hypothetical protein Asp14428_12210 [Actinoplanes sp. NBRC 14428]
MLLRRMAAHPGPDLDDHAAAALLGTDRDTAVADLRHLTGEHLVQQPVSGRYVLHDLVRAYTADRAREEDRPAERRESLSRLFDHYVHGAAAAMDALYPAERHRRPVLPPRPPGGPALDDPKTALLWLDGERAGLVAVCLHAVRLAGILYAYLDNGGHPADAFTVHTEAQHAARLLGDGLAEATALAHLGVVCWQLGRHPEAIGHLSRALALFRELGDGPGEARTLGNLGVVHSAAGQRELSATYQEQALDRFVRLGDRLGEANTLTNLGSMHVRMGLPAPAAGYNLRARRLPRAGAPWRGGHRAEQPGRRHHPARRLRRGGRPLRAGPHDLPRARRAVRPDLCPQRARCRAGGTGPHRRGDRPAPGGAGHGDRPAGGAGPRPDRAGPPHRPRR